MVDNNQPLKMQLENLADLCRLMRYWILKSTHDAGSGHPTSALSAVELMATLFFRGHFRFAVDDPQGALNDRLIFSKGHASPLFYALWAAAGAIDADELTRYRQFDSDLEGHPTWRFRYTEAATGSLGQGLSVGAGMALGSQRSEVPFRTFVLLGDSEMAEGSQWEAMQLAAHYQLGQLVGILDLNRLGQRGGTMLERDLDGYRCRIEAFGWRTLVVEDGHSLEQLDDAYQQVLSNKNHDRPAMIIANTVKGQGVSFLEDADGWHGKVLDDDQLQQALQELGNIDTSLRGHLVPPAAPLSPHLPSRNSQEQAIVPLTSEQYPCNKKVATRTAYGNALVRLASGNPELIALDGEVSNSTKAESLKESSPTQFVEAFVAEQNMVGMAVGLALRGYVPFVSSFAAFLTRAFDQIRMAVYSAANVKFVGSHCGVSIGQDGPSQMGLEDIAMFRSLHDSIVLYPCDAVSTERLMERLLEHRGIGYLRTTRGKTPVIYDIDTEFQIGGSHVLRQTNHDEVTLIGAGITLHEALAAADQLAEQGTKARVIDLYSIQPLDKATLSLAARETQGLVVVEDHFVAGGIAEAVRSALWDIDARIVSLAVTKRPRSGPPERLLQQQEIDADSIVRTAHQLLRTSIASTSNASTSNASSTSGKG